MTADWAEVFCAAATRAAGVLERSAIRWKVGTWRDAVFLKLQKAHWTGGEVAGDPFGRGVFFSVWVDEKGLKENRVFYNLHALKLRALPGYSIESRKFAEAFRKEFAAFQSAWPHVSTDYGPQNLMQGWIANGEGRTAELDQLVGGFLDLPGMIDELLREKSGTART